MSNAIATQVQQTTSNLSKGQILTATNTSNVSKQPFFGRNLQPVSDRELGIFGRTTKFGVKLINTGDARHPAIAVTASDPKVVPDDQRHLEKYNCRDVQRKKCDYEGKNCRTVMKEVCDWRWVNYPCHAKAKKDQLSVRVHFNNNGEHNALQYKTESAQPKQAMIVHEKAEKPESMLVYCASLKPAETSQVARICRERDVSGFNFNFQDAFSFEDSEKGPIAIGVGGVTNQDKGFGYCEATANPSMPVGVSIDTNLDHTAFNRTSSNEIDVSSMRANSTDPHLNYFFETSHIPGGETHVFYKGEFHAKDAFCKMNEGRFSHRHHISNLGNFSNAENMNAFCGFQDPIDSKRAALTVATLGGFFTALFVVYKIKSGQWQMPQVQMPNIPIPNFGEWTAEITNLFSGSQASNSSNAEVSQEVVVEASDEEDEEEQVVLPFG